MSSVYVIEILSPLAVGMGILQKKYILGKKIKNFFQTFQGFRFFLEISDISDNPKSD